MACCVQDLAAGGPGAAEVDAGDVMDGGGGADAGVEMFDGGEE